MSDGINKVFLVGTLGQDPELRFTGSGQSLLTIRMATNERFKKKDGEWADRSEWHTVILWGARSEALSKILTKGSTIAIDGRLQTRSWEAKDGTKRYTTEIVANTVALMGGGRSMEREAYDGPPSIPEDDDIDF